MGEGVVAITDKMTQFDGTLVADKVLPEVESFHHVFPIEELAEFIDMIISDI